MADKYLENLNKEQKEAVLHKDGPLLIVAGAGTGKTSVITSRLAYLIENNLAKSDEILAVTFTEKAAEEMEERVDRILPFGYLDLWVSTFHSFCERILKQHAIDIGLSNNFKLLDQTGAWILIRDNFDKFKLDYYKPMGSPTRFIHALIKHFSRLKDEVIYPEDYIQYADDIKRNFDTGVFSKKDEAEIEVQRITEIADAYHVYQKLLLENNALDFSDLINYCIKLFEKRPAILKKYQEQFKYILVDEFQDTNWAQYELIKLLGKPRNNLTVTTDDDQCLPGNAKIQIFENGEVKEKLIQNIKSGEMVLTGVGKGHVGISKVSKIFKKRKRARMLTIVTDSGRELEVTDNHKMFCFVPKTSQQGYHYVYLMYRQDIGWRIGVTDDLILRLRLERSADFIVGIKAFSTDREARYYETLWSLKYGIPTSCFKKREGTVIEGQMLKNLYQELDVSKNVLRLAQELQIDLDSPHHCLNAVIRGSKKRVIININMCERRYRSKAHVKKGKLLLLNSSIKHEVYLETSDIDTLNKIKKAGYHLNDAKKGKYFRIESTNFQKVGQIAEELRKLTGGIIKVKFNIASKYNKIQSHRRTYSATVMPAKNLLQGHYLPIRDGAEVIYDRIIDIKEKECDEVVYDLEIDRTHNFIANGIFVHNSIYRFRGASVSNVLQFQKDFPKVKEVVLTNNYRSTQNILDLSYNFIQLNNPDRLEYQGKFIKKLKSSSDKKGIVQHLHFKDSEQETKGVVKKILEILAKDKKANYSDFTILARTNATALTFSKEFERQRLPYEFLACYGLYSQPVIIDIISYLKLLDNYHESSALNRILGIPILNINWQDSAKINQYSRKKAQSTYETLNEISLVSGLEKDSIEKIRKLLKWIKQHTELAKTKSTSEVVLAFLKDSSYLKYLLKNGEDREIGFITQFYNKIKKFEETNLNALVSDFVILINMELESGETGAIERDLEKGPDAVRVMTIHSAKGLEFKYVFIVNLVDKRFPTIERKEPIEIPKKLIKEILPTGDIHLQEERRLFYVAMTRAKEGLFLTSAEDYGGKRKKKMSRFLEELDPRFLTSKQEIGGLEEEGVIGKDSSEKINIPKAKTLKKESSYFSFTQFKAFENCPLQYKFAHILRIPSRGKGVFSFGKTIHNTLFQYLEGVKNNQKDLFGKEMEQNNDLKALLKLYESNWIDEWYETKEQKDEYFKLGKDILKNFLKDFKKPELLGLEMDFRLKLGDDIIKGTVDRVDKTDEGIEIIDYKTGKSKDRLTADDKDQLLIYQIALNAIFKKLPEKLTFYYLNNNKKMSFTSTEKERKELKEKLKEKIQAIKESDFSPTPGWHCKTCDFKDVCEFKKI